MDFFLDGVKYAGRVEMAAFGLNRFIFGENDKSEAVEITIEDRRKLNNLCKALDKAFYGMDGDISYSYHLDMMKIKDATLSDIVIGITAVEERTRNGNTPNQIPINPSILIRREQVNNSYRKNDMTKVTTLVSLLSELKQFITVDLKDKLFNGSSINNTTLRALLPEIISRAPVTPRGSRAAASFGGRRTKRNKCANRSKRSKHTKRRKH